MRHFSALLLLVGVFFGVQAHAQFANQSVFLSVGYQALSDPSVSGGFPVGLGYSRYLDDGFEVTAHWDLMILNRKIDNQQVIGTEFAPGIRYLFLEESFRPYVGLELSVLYISSIETTQWYAGVGPFVGADYFLTDSFSLGLRGQVTVHLMINAPVTTAAGGRLIAAVYF